jgi:hypothetical protein
LFEPFAADFERRHQSQTLQGSIGFLTGAIQQCAKNRIPGIFGMIAQVGRIAAFVRGVMFGTYVSVSKPQKLLQTSNAKGGKQAGGDRTVPIEQKGKRLLRSRPPIFASWPGKPTPHIVDSLFGVNHQEHREITHGVFGALCPLMPCQSAPRGAGKRFPLVRAQVEAGNQLNGKVKFVQISGFVGRDYLE